MEVIFFLTSTTLCFYQKQIGFSIDNNSFDQRGELCTSFQSEISFHCFNENINHRPFWKRCQLLFLIYHVLILHEFPFKLGYSFLFRVCFSLPLPGKLPCPNSSLFTPLIQLGAVIPSSRASLICYVFITQLNRFLLKARS
jgi:hypothetical protein